MEHTPTRPTPQAFAERFGPHPTDYAQEPGVAELPARLGAPVIRAFDDLPQARMHHALARRRAYLHPFRWTSLGLSLIEAMQLGMPVLALATTDAATRVQLEHEMQQTEYNIGGYIIPFFGGLIDGYSAKVKGLKPSKGTLNLDSFGHGYRTIWFG